MLTGSAAAAMRAMCLASAVAEVIDHDAIRTAASALSRALCASALSAMRDPLPRFAAASQ